MAMSVNIQRLRELVNTAMADPPGEGMVPSLPWHVENEGKFGHAIYSTEQHNDGAHVNIADDLRAADAALVCAALNALPELLDRLENAERENERWAHGQTIESDGICSHQWEVMRLNDELKRMKVVCAAAFGFIAAHRSGDAVDQRHAHITLATAVDAAGKETP